MIQKEKFDELEKKQNELRQKRNQLSEEQQKIQKEIDDIEIQKYDAERYVGKVIVVKKNISPTYNMKQYMIVDRVQRLYQGPRFYGKSFEICYSNNTKIGNSIYMYERSEVSAFSWASVDNIKTIDPEQLKKEINEFLNKFDYGNEMNKLKTHHGED